MWRNFALFLALVATAVACDDTVNSRSTHVVLGDSQSTDTGASSPNGNDAPSCVDGVSPEELEAACGRAPMAGHEWLCLSGQCHEATVCNPGFVRDGTRCINPQPAQQDPNDGDPCTRDVVDPQTGMAVNPRDLCADTDQPGLIGTCVPDESRTTGYRCDFACQQDNNPCTEHVLEQGTCVERVLPDMSACGDGAICRAGVCGDGDCVEHADCQDGNACTVDRCVEGVCVHPQNPMACEDLDGSSWTCAPDPIERNVPNCTYTADPVDPPEPPGCDLEDRPVSNDACETFECVLRPDGSAHWEAAPAIVCESDNPSVISTCVEVSVDGEQQPACRESPRCAASEVYSDEDGDGVFDCICAEGFMRPAQGEACAPAEPAAAGCEDGQRHCAQFEDQDNFSYAVCVEGNWVQIAECAPRPAGLVSCRRDAGCLR